VIRRAKVGDVKAIHKLVNEYARRQEMLPRSLNELYENIRDFFVYELDSEVAGACAIHILWEDLAEI
jgi:amino-acid N-acetyltransferase